MEVRSGGLAGIADLTYLLSPLELLALGHIYRVEVGIACLVSEAVVYDDLIAVAEELIPHLFHNSVSRGVNRIADLAGRKIYSVVESDFVFVKIGLLRIITFFLLSISIAFSNSIISLICKHKILLNR